MGAQGAACGGAVDCCAASILTSLTNGCAGCGVAPRDGSGVATERRAGRRRIDAAERRARLASRHHLAQPATAVETVAASLVGLHSSDPATVYLAARARVSGFQVSHLEQRALRSALALVRVLGMRRTMFVVPPDLAVVIHAACTRALAPAERRRMERLLSEQGIAADAAGWLEEVERRTLTALAAHGQATARELTGEVPELARKLSFGAGRKWAGTVGVSTRVLFLLATEGRIVRRAPAGVVDLKPVPVGAGGHMVGGRSRHPVRPSRPPVPSCCAAGWRRSDPAP